MGELIEKILGNYELLFVMIFVIGSAVSGVLKQMRAKKHAQKQREAFRSWTPGQAGDAAAGGATTRQAASPSGRLDETLASLEAFFKDAEQDTVAPEDALPSRPAPKPAPRLAPPEPQPAQPLVELEGLHTERLSSLPEFESFDMPAFESAAFDIEFESIESLPSVMSAGGRITDADATSAQTGRVGWTPSVGWREAIIMREVLEAPRAFRQNQLPGLDPDC